VTDYRFSVIPAGAITDTQLKLRDLQVLALIGRHTNKQGWCSRSHRTIAVELDCVRSTVQASLDRLYAAGYISRRLRGLNGKERQDDGKHPYRAHFYRVLLDRDDQRAQKIGHLAAQKIGHGVPENDEKSSENADNIRSAPGADDFEDADDVDLIGGTEVVAEAEVPQNGKVSAPYEPTPYEPTPYEPLGERTANLRIKGSAQEPLNGTSPSTFSKTGDTEQSASSAQFAEFMAKWPTAASDDQHKALRAWCALPLDERLAALNGIQDFLTKLKADKRDHIPASWKYLEQKRWVLVAASASTHGFQTWSRDWWAVWITKIDSGAGGSAWLAYADQAGQPVKRFCAVKADAMPSLDQLAMLTAYPSDGDAIAAWRPWFERHGVRLQQWTERFWVFLPSATPPSGKSSVWGRCATAPDASKVNGRSERPLNDADAGRPA
jgi:predicted transcriptional regulator